MIELGHSKRITASECIFQPSFVGYKHDELGDCYGGIANLAYHSIEKCDQDLKMSLYSNVVLAGGTTLNSQLHRTCRCLAALSMDSQT